MTSDTNEEAPRRERALGLSRLGDAWKATGELAKALGALQEALAREAPESADVARDAAVLQKSLGDVRIRIAATAADAAQALPDLREACHGYRRASAAFDLLRARGALEEAAAAKP